MRRYISICLLLVVLVLQSFPAETLAQGQASGGLKGGISFAGQYGDDTGGFAYIDDDLGEVRVGKMESKLGFSLGAFVTYKANKVFALQPEIYFSSKGTIEKIEISDLLIEYRWRLDYVEAPLLFKFFVPTDAPVAPNIFLGPAMAITISTKRGAAIHPTWEYEVDIDDVVKDMDFGLVFGGSFDIDIRRAILIVECRYTLGLVSWYDAPDDENSLDIKNGVLTVMAGIASPFGR